MKYAHGVLDLETLGNTSNAPIVQIGISLPDQHRMPGGAVFNAKIMYSPEDDYGFHSDKSTQEWWAKQDEATRMMVFESHLDSVRPVTLEQALRDMNNFLELYKKDYNVDEITLWSHATFDPPILINAASRITKELNRFRKLIHYRDFKDFRTTDWILGTAMKGFIYDQVNKIVEPMNLTHHYAPDDALYEHYVLDETLRILRMIFKEAEQDTTHLHLIGEIIVPEEDAKS